MLKNQVTMDNAALHVEETKQVMIVSIKLNITKANMGNIMVGSLALTVSLQGQPLWWCNNQVWHIKINDINMGNIMVGSTGLHSQPLAVYSLYSVQLYSTVVQYIKNSN